MPRNIVVAPFSYVSFELCMKLMENGQEVIGVEPSLPYLDKREREEKELYLGRNANWVLCQLEEFSLRSEEESVIYVCHVNPGWSAIQDFLEELKEVSCKIVYITHATQQPFMNVTEWSKSNVWIHLPSMYGSWQPENSFFEHSLIDRSFPFEEYEREDRRDVLYIDDAINAIIEVAELEGGAYQLRSGVENHWDEVLKEIGYSILYDSIGVAQDREYIVGEQVHYADARIKPEQGVEMLRRHRETIEKRIRSIFYRK